MIRRFKKGLASSTWLPKSDVEIEYILATGHTIGNVNVPGMDAALVALPATYPNRIQLRSMRYGRRLM